MRIKSVLLIFLIIFAFTANVALAASPESEALTLEDLLLKIQSNQSKINDMYAETTTTITSSIAMPGSQTKGPQKMVQKGRMWTKGKDKSKIEMLSPMKQITITNGDQMAIINPETGQKMIQDLSKMKGQGIQGSRDQGMDLDKAKEYFDLKVKKLDASKPGALETYVITGVPREKNKFLSKMEFYVDSTRWVPVKILMYGAKDKLMNNSKIEYEKIEIGSGKNKDRVWIPVKNASVVNTPMGKMEVEMIFENVKINKGIKDEEFEI